MIRDILVLIQSVLETLKIPLGILILISEWKLFKKAGRPGWACIIPFYSYFVKSDILFGNAFYFVAAMIFELISVIFLLSDSLILALLLILVNFGFQLWLGLGYAKVFGKSTLYGIGIWLLPFIFYPIMAFGEANYIGHGYVEPNIDDNYYKSDDTFT